MITSNKKKQTLTYDTPVSTLRTAHTALSRITPRLHPARARAAPATLPPLPATGEEGSATPARLGIHCQPACERGGEHDGRAPRACLLSCRLVFFFNC